MLVVLAIIGLLLSAARPVHELVQRRVQEQALREALRSIRLALDAHRDAVLARRIAASAGGSPWPATLEALEAGVPLLDEGGQPRSDGARLYLMRRLPRDPFADPALPAAQTWAQRASTSPHDAPAAGEDVFDVRSGAAGLGLDGTAYASW
jgi:general secretion pathway protein G